MKTILVAVDGSDHAYRAVELAADIATKYDAELLLLHVVDNRPLTEAEKRLAESEYSDQIQKRMQTSDVIDFSALRSRGIDPVFTYHAETGLILRTALGEGVLDAAARDAGAKGAMNIEKILENGDPADVILDVADKRGVNLIVIGSRGRSDMKAMFLGSVSHKVANLADVNVITVK